MGTSRTTFHVKKQEFTQLSVASEHHKVGQLVLLFFKGDKKHDLNIFKIIFISTINYHMEMDNYISNCILHLPLWNQDFHVQE